MTLLINKKPDPRQPGALGSRPASSRVVMVALTLVMSVLFCAGTAHAVDLHFDNNGTTAGFGSAGGTWGVDSLWNTDNTGGGGGSFTATTTGNDQLWFGRSTGGGLGTGTLSVSGTVASGTIRFANNSGIITIGASAGAGTINMGGGNDSIRAESGGTAGAHVFNVNITKSSGNLSLGTQISGGERYTFNGVISGGMSLTSRLQNNTTLVSLNGLNTFTGDTTLGTGQFTINTITNSGVAQSLGQGNTFTMGFNGNQQPVLRYASATAGSTDKTIRIRASSRIVARNGPLDFTGTVQSMSISGGSAQLRLGGTANTGMNTISGTIQDADGVPLSVLVRRESGFDFGAEDATWTFSGTSTYSGNTTIANFSRLIAGSTTGLSPNSAMVINDSGDLELNGFSNAVGSLAGSASARVEGNTGTPALTLSGLGDTVYQGTITDAGGTLSIVKAGSGTQTLNSTYVGSYSGTTTINAGTLQVDGTHTGAGDYTVNSGGRLAGSGSIDGTALNLSLNAGSFFNPSIFDFGFGNDASDVFDIKGAVTGTGTQSLEFTVGQSLSTVLMGASTLDIGSGLLEFDDFNFSPSGLEVFTDYVLFDAGSITGSLGTFKGGTIGGFGATLEIQGNDVVLVVGDLLIAPEPNTVALLVVGGWMLYHERRRRRATTV